MLRWRQSSPSLATNLTVTERSHAHSKLCCATFKKRISNTRSLPQAETRHENQDGHCQSHVYYVIIPLPVLNLHSGAEDTAPRVLHNNVDVIAKLDTRVHTFHCPYTSDLTENDRAKLLSLKICTELLIYSIYNLYRAYPSHS